VTEGLQAQRDYALVQLAKLERRGTELLEGPTTDRDAGERHRGATRLWQQDCAAAIHQLAGGSKAHWLSRSFSEALLVQSGGGAVIEPDLKEIVGRIIEVLERARQSLTHMDEVAVASSAAAPSVHRFDFVHNAQLRPVLEQAFDESGRAFEEGDFSGSLITSCSIIEALLTDALEHCGVRISDRGLTCTIESAIRSPQSAITGRIADWSFDERVAAAEKAGLIRGGCARLPATARTYRDGPSSTMPVTGRDAKVARQVLHVVMRDLDPGR
jgi:hypothetical protein